MLLDLRAPDRSRSTPVELSSSETPTAEVFSVTPIRILSKKTTLGKEFMLYIHTQV
jgi:hypothetical protein